MPLFGRKRVKGISEYELKHERVLSRLDSVFPSYRASSKIKRAALHTALGLGLDSDKNMSANQKGVIQRDEFESAIGGLEEGGVISSKEAEKLRKAAEKALSD